MRIILGLLFIIVGTLVTVKSEWLYLNFGSIAFFDKYLHSSGGGRLGYKLSGVLAVVVGIFVVTNLHERVLQGIANLFVPGA